MDILHEPVKRGLAELLQAALKEIGVEEGLEDVYRAFGPTPNVELGHLAFPCFKYAKALKQAPNKVAEDLAGRLPGHALVAEAKAAGPYLNFFLSLGELGRLSVGEVLSGDLFRRKLTADTPRTMIEYSQPNTHKEVHVGHMRNMALGDALIRLHRYAGYDIVSTTFPGDVGTHVAKCLWYMQNVNTEAVPETGRGQWLGQMYAKASQLLKQLKDEGNDAEANATITEILKQLEGGSGPYYDLWRETRDWSIDLMKTVYDWAHIEFDVWYWESDVDAASVAYARKLYAEGKLIESNGAIGMDLSEYGLGFAMLLKRDGTGLYATKDVELARRKFEDYQVERSVYVVDTRQAHHFKQVFKVLELLGFEQAKDCFHLAYEHVGGKTGTFSSREGNAPPVMELISLMEEAILKNYLQEQVDKGDMTAAEAKLIATVVAEGAIKYGMLRIDPGKIITFILEEWIGLDGDTGAYQQYTYARIQSLCQKQGFDLSGPMDWSLLTDVREAELMVRMSEFNDVVLRAVGQYRPNLLCAYLFGLAQLYNTVNNAIILRDIADPVLRNTRLGLHYGVGLVIRAGLSLLGMGVVGRM